MIVLDIVSLLILTHLIGEKASRPTQSGPWARPLCGRPKLQITAAGKWSMAAISLAHHHSVLLVLSMAGASPMTPSHQHISVWCNASCHYIAVYWPVISSLSITSQIIIFQFSFAGVV